MCSTLIRITEFTCALLSSCKNEGMCLEVIKKYFRVVTIGTGDRTKTGEFMEKFQRGGGYFQSKNLYRRFWKLIQGLKQGFSVLVPPPVPKFLGKGEEKTFCQTRLSPRSPSSIPPRLGVRFTMKCQSQFFSFTY